ncbi:MAG TPA: tetratricopeptide repeat-containing sensor histidine kinase [Noviherbaspirillum sp.]
MANSVDYPVRLIGSLSNFCGGRSNEVASGALLKGFEAMSLRISMLCLMFILVSFAPMKASAEEAVPSPIQAEVARLQILFGTDQDQAVKRLLALKEHLPASATQVDRRKVLAALVDMYLNKHDHAQARKFNQELAEFGSAYHDDWARTFVFGEGALLDLSDGKTIDAVLNIEQALNIAQQTGDKKLIGSTNDIAGHIYGDLGDFPLALQHALIALSMLEGHEQRDEMRRAAAMNNIGTLYETMKNPDLALEYNEKAREIAERIDAQYILLSLALTRGAAYSQLEKFADAKISFTDALTIARKISDRSGEAASLGGLSNIAFKQNLFGDCIKLAEEAEGLAKQLKDEDLLTDIGKNVGFCHIGMGAVQRGEEEVNSVIDFLHNANEDPAVADVLGEMALAYEKGGLYKEALKAMQQQRDLKDSLLRKNHDRTLAEMQAKFDAAERQKQMEKLEQENRFQKIEIENKNLQRIVGLAALIIVISIAYALVRKKEILRRKAHLENKNKSKFVAEAAHDLRQPMQAISNLLEAMKQAASKDDMSKCKELIGTAQIATQAMRTSFNSVLELSRLEYGLVSAEYSSFHLDELIDELIVSLQPLADERGVIIRTKFRRKESPAVKSDRVLLGRVISNLLSNAIKYSDPAKGTHAAVSVSVAALADSYHVSIAVSGNPAAL